MSLNKTDADSGASLSDDELGRCLWKHQEDEDCWDTECGNKFVLEVGTPIENDFHFCPYCGKGLFDEWPNERNSGGAEGAPSGMEG